MGFWETVITGVIAGVVAAGVIGAFTWAYRSSKPEPDFKLIREGGSWYLLRVERSPAINVQWSVSDRLGVMVHGGEPFRAPPDILHNDIELIPHPLVQDDQLTVFWGAHDRTNSHAVTIRSGVAEYDVWRIGKRPKRHESR